MTTAMLLITWWQKIHTWSLSSFTIDGLRFASNVVHHPPVRPSSIDIMPISSQKFLSFQIGNFSPPPSMHCSKVWLQMGRNARQYPDSDSVSQRGITLTNTWTEEINSYKPSCLPSMLSTAHLPKKLSRRKSTTGLWKCGENSALKTCNNTTTSIKILTMFLKIFSKRASWTTDSTPCIIIL